MSYEGYDELIEYIDRQQDDVQAYSRAVLQFIHSYQTEYPIFQNALATPHAFVESVIDEMGGETSASAMAGDFRRQLHTITIHEGLPCVDEIVSEILETGTWERPGAFDPVEEARPAPARAASTRSFSSSASNDPVLTPPTPQSPPITQFQLPPHAQIEEPGNYWPNIQLWLDSWSPPGTTQTGQPGTAARPTITCTICGDELVVEEGGLQPPDGERERLFRLRCGHVFGVVCLKGWDEAGAAREGDGDGDDEREGGTKCPTCRQPILRDELMELEEAAIASLD